MAGHDQAVAAHLDLDALTYQRLPGDTSKSFDHDNAPVRIGRVVRWPAVGGSSLLFYDDPESPALEQYRASSPIRRIERLPQP